MKKTKIRRVILAVLALSMVLLLGACNGPVDEPAGTTAYTGSSYTGTTERYTQREAESDLKSFLNSSSGKNAIINELLGDYLLTKDKVTVISSVYVGSYEFDRKDTSGYGSNERTYYAFNVYGTFYGKDNYGKIIDEYTFDAEVRVEEFFGCECDSAFARVK